MTAPVPDQPTAHAYVVDDDAALRAELADTLAAAGLEVRTFPMAVPSWTNRRCCPKAAWCSTSTCPD